MRPATLCLLALLASGCTATPAAAPADYQWRQGAQLYRVEAVPNVVASFGADSPASHVAGAEPLGRYGDVTLWRLPQSADVATVVQAPQTSPVFRDSGGQLRALPGGVIVVLDPSWSGAQALAWLGEQGFDVERTLPGPANAFWVRTPPGMAALQQTRRLLGRTEVIEAYPNWWEARAPRR